MKLTRKSPIRHKVKSHTRKSKRVNSYVRGNGTKLNPSTKRRTRKKVVVNKIRPIIRQEQRIPLSKIIVPEHIELDTLDKETIKHNVKLLKEDGRLAPIIVSGRGDKFFIRDGWHRYLAYKELGYKEIPAVSAKNRS